MLGVPVFLLFWARLNGANAMTLTARHNAAIQLLIAAAALTCSSSAYALTARGGFEDTSTATDGQPLPGQQPLVISPQSDPIIVIGERRPVDSINSEILSEADLTSYGANSVSELIDEIVAERGRPADEVVYLVDGKRVTGLGDIASYPSETVAAVEIYPVGSAGQVGGNGNQRVVNIKLKPAARIVVARSGIGTATDGGLREVEGEASFTTITAPRRANLSVLWRTNDALLESERNVVQIAGVPADLGQFRSLRPEGEQIELRGSYSDQLSPEITAFLTTRVSNRENTAFLGITENGERLDQTNELTNADTGLQVSGQFDGWLVNLGTTYGVTRSITRTGPGSGATVGEPGLPAVRARIERLASEISVTKALIDVAAGPVNLTVRTRLSRDTINATGTDFTQSLRQVGGGLFVPIARPRLGPLGALGEINASIDFSAGNYSDIGSVSTAIYALQWHPADWLGLSGSISQGRTPPGVELLAAPFLVTPGTRYLDPLSQESVDVLAISGGNPALASQRADERQFSVEIRPRNSILSALSAELRSSSNIDIISSFPPANSLLILAFPDRFVRDMNGRLIEVDTRPVNFAARREEQLRYGFELTVPSGGSAGVADLGRLSLLVSHTIQLENEIQIVSGLEPVDLLSRDAFGFGGGEQSRHEVDAILRYAQRGLGVRLGARYRSTGFINLVDGSETVSLRFAPLTTFELRAFAEGQRLIPSIKFFSGARFTLAINNITNARQQVRDNVGDIPIAYQPAYRDPTGRLFRVEFRKVF